jgi:hypothetical protein
MICVGNEFQGFLEKLECFSRVFYSLLKQTNCKRAPENVKKLIATHTG